jgi:hypothetical protein
MTTPRRPQPITEWTTYRRRIEWHPYRPGDPRALGRNVHHDSRNLAYPYRRTAPTLVSVLHARNAPILDQGQVGSCTGNGETGVLATDPNFAALPPHSPALNEALALRIYSGAETIDGDGPYPPNDNGSSGPSAAKAAMALGLIAGYTHILSLADLEDALQTQGVSIGINWYDSFDNPPASGLLTISPDASVRGGHEPMLRGIDVSNRQFYGDNSWGTSWGVKGSFTIGYATMERLLGEQGDGTVSVPVGQPAPTPVPVPTPTPTPVPGGDPASDTLWAATNEWAAGHHTGANAAAADAVNVWGTAKGYH